MYLNLSQLLHSMDIKAQVHSKNNLLSIEPKKIRQTNQKRFEQNRITNKKVYECLMTWNTLKITTQIGNSLMSLWRMVLTIH